MTQARATESRSRQIGRTRNATVAASADDGALNDELKSSPPVRGPSSLVHGRGAAERSEVLDTQGTEADAETADYLKPCDHGCGREGPQRDAGDVGHAHRDQHDRQGQADGRQDDRESPAPLDLCRADVASLGGIRV